jgi:protein TonB
MSTATEVREPEVQKPIEVWQPRQMSLSVRQVPVRPLLGDILLEPSDLQRRRRTLAAVLSFAFQCATLGVALIVPLMFTDELPKQKLLTSLVAPVPPPPPPPSAALETAKVGRRVESSIINGHLRTPGRIPQKVQMIREEEAPPALSSGGVIGGIPGGQIGGVIGGETRRRRDGCGL